MGYPLPMAKARRIANPLIVYQLIRKFSNSLEALLHALLRPEMALKNRDAFSCFNAGLHIPIRRPRTTSFQDTLNLP
jgi:hypothetical protein